MSAEADGDLSMKIGRFCSEIGHWQLDGLNYCFHPPLLLLVRAQSGLSLLLSANGGFRIATTTQGKL